VAHHRDQPEITLFLKIGFDAWYAPARRFTDGLDEQTFTDSELDSNVVWTETVDAEINNSEESLCIWLLAVVIPPTSIDNGIKKRGQIGRLLYALGGAFDHREGLSDKRIRSPVNNWMRKEIQ